MKALRRSNTSTSNRTSSSSPALSWIHLGALFIFASYPAPDRGILKAPWSRGKGKGGFSRHYWNSLFTPDGRLRDGGIKFLGKARSKGIDPSIRSEVWPFLLGMYDLNSSQLERSAVKLRKWKEYEKLRKRCLVLSNHHHQRSALVTTNKVYNEVHHNLFEDLWSKDYTVRLPLSVKWSGDEVHPVYDRTPDSSPRNVDAGDDEEDYRRTLAENDSSDSDFFGELEIVAVPDTKLMSSAFLNANGPNMNVENFRTWQRIIRLDAIRADAEWVIYAPIQANISEELANHYAKNVGLKDYDHLEPCIIYHASRLVSVLEAYAIYDPEIGYCQGMSDLLSPLLIVMKDDYEVFWCFVGFMRKARQNFRLDEFGIKRQLAIVSRIIRSKDAHLYQHLEKLQANDCFFVYRMVLVLLRRELNFEQTLCLWEVMWADQAAIRTGIGGSTCGRMSLRAPPTDDLLLYAIAASVLKRRKLFIEKYCNMDEIMRECNNMTGKLDVWKLLDDAHDLAESTSAESVAALGKIDTVKQRMEATYETLQDAAGLTQLSASVEDVFASGDLPRAAETLANMRQCLSAVGEVAEFANVRKQLEVLEDRLEEMVQPRLSDAFTHRKVEAVQDLRQILVRIGRYKSLELHYTKMHVKPLKKIWEDFESRQRTNKLEIEKHGERRSNISDFTTNSSSLSFSNWLPSFYDELLLYLEHEWKWCMNALPEDYISLVPKLLDETMTELCSSFVQRINLATGDVVPETKTLFKGVMDIISGDIPNGTKILNKHLDALIELHNMTSAFSRNIHHLFAESDVKVLRSTLKSVYSSYEVYKQRYGQMERAILSSAISKIDIRGAVTRGVGAQGIELSETVRRMEESIPQVIVLLEAAVERCISFTGGSEVDELLGTLDEMMLQYLSNLQDTLKSLRSVCGVDNVVQSDNSKKDTGIDKKEGARAINVVSEEEEWSIVQGALQILTVADCLTSRASVFEASLRATLARIGTSLSLFVFGLNIDQSHLASDNANVELPVAGRVALDVASLRLSNMPEKARKLFNLLEQSKDPRFHALPLTSQRVAAFAETVNELVYDVLISKVRQRLNDVSRLPIWSSVEEPSAHPLPSFSSYPQAYVTSVGEYLLTLPQQLEPLAEGFSNNESSNEEVQFFATEWMFKVAEGATALFVEQLRGIHYITERGAQQLSADIEYLSNVLSALSMPIPPFLSTFHTFVSTPRDGPKPTC